MKIAGLFVLVFACALFNKAMGLDDVGIMIATVIGAGSYILLIVGD